jgi:hypothetical protein
MHTKLRVLAGLGGNPNHVEIMRFGSTDPHATARVHATEFAGSLRAAADRCDQGHHFRLIGAHAAGGVPCTMVSGGCDPLLPTIQVWGKRFRWVMDPQGARGLADTLDRAVGRARRMDLGVTVPCLNVAV